MLITFDTWQIFNSRNFFSRPHSESKIKITITNGAAPGGGRVMTLHDNGYLPPEFLKSYPVSE